MLHTLRWLIGDRAFREVTRLAVYGRSDPKPGNFTPRFLTSADYQTIVARVTGKDYGWFFDVYLRQAGLPDLLSERHGGMLSLHWVAPGTPVFPMPVEVRIGDRTVRLAMADGTGRIAAPADAHVVIDPDAHVLRRSAAVEAYQAWQDAQRKAR